MNDLLQLVESLSAPARAANGKSPLADLGFISCAGTVHIKRVPFYEPCVLLVLSGRKVIHDAERTLYCHAGDVLTVPAPTTIDLRNEPDPLTRQYRALVVPFSLDLLERLGRLHDLPPSDAPGGAGVLSFERDEVLLAAVRHYLAAIGRVRLQSHRLMEILLLLVEKRPALLSYVLRQKHWSRRVRAILASDLTVAWDIAQVCRRLATTESTLRRHLKLEDTGFRELLYELRLSSALAQLLQTPLPISRVAYDCGYQSVSRFSSNFHKRYGLSPRALREAMSETGHTTPVSGQIPTA